MLWSMLIFRAKQSVIFVNVSRDNKRKPPGSFREAFDPSSAFCRRGLAGLRHVFTAARSDDTFVEVLELQQDGHCFFGKFPVALGVQEFPGGHPGIGDAVEGLGRLGALDLAMPAAAAE